MLDFMEKSSVWTEDPILSDDGSEVQLSIEAIRAEVEDYAARAYKMGKANKEVGKGGWLSVNQEGGGVRAPTIFAGNTSVK